MRPDSTRATDSSAPVPLSVIPLHSTNLLTVLDANSIIQYESPSIERIFGFDQDELVGEQVAEYFHPDDREKVVGAFQEIVASETYTVETVEYRHKQADGSYTWAESVASADPTPEGNYVINTRDISARKAREQELEQTNQRLDEFASIVSHDLRNPLNVATGRVKLAQEECDSEHLDAVARAHDRMESLIDGLLSFTRAGTEGIELQPIELAKCAKRCWQHVNTAGATLNAETDLVLKADEERVRQLLENLFRNAVEHGNENVTVSVGELTERSGFYVEDTGPGIPESVREKVFESGFSTRDSGTGLGLAIVSQIAMAHNWEIKVTESNAEGARFEITGVDVVQ